MDEVFGCVIGAGVIGLAIGARLAAPSRSFLILDEQANFGQDISSRNSEVIHAGIYYEKDSLKARLCVEGKERLYAYCEKNHISHRRIGKAIVANNGDDEAVLASIAANAANNGVDDLTYWSQGRLLREEPNVHGCQALFSPSSGIISSHELMLSLLHEAESEGAVFSGRTKVICVDIEKDRFVVHTQIGETETYSFSCRVLINAAGLGAQQVASCINGLDSFSIPQLHLCKGNYFGFSGASPFKHLIYPVPDPTGAGLGIHATLDLGGQIRFGPDVEYVDEVDYRVSEEREGLYYDAIRRYFPGLPDGSLSPAYAGIRPKLQAENGKTEDFVIQGVDEHGTHGLVQLFGIESPGLTAALAVAETVRDRLRGYC